MAAKPETNFTSFLDPAVQTLEDAFMAGVKIQENVTKFWSDAFDQAGVLQDWQKRSQALIKEVIPAAQKNAENWMRILEENYRSNIELLRRMLSGDGFGEEAQTRTKEAWETSLGMLRDSAQAVAQTNMKMLGMWTDMFRRNVAAAQEMGKTAAASASPGGRKSAKTAASD